MKVASAGAFLNAEVNNTGLIKLLTKYSAEAYLAESSNHSASGTDVDAHLIDRSFGSGMTLFKILVKISATGFN